jgi:hypothetical protein
MEYKCLKEHLKPQLKLLQVRWIGKPPSYVKTQMEPLYNLSLVLTSMQQVRWNGAPCPLPEKMLHRFREIIKFIE